MPSLLILLGVSIILLFFPSTAKACLPKAKNHVCYLLYTLEERTKPCCSPSYTYIPWRRISPSTEILNFLWERKELISLIRLIENCNVDNLYSKPMYHVSSKAFPISISTIDVDKLLFNFKVMWSVSVIHWSAVLWRGRKPNCLPLIRHFRQCAFGLFRE
jgi:hypothetical protein